VNPARAGENDPVARIAAAAERCCAWIENPPEVVEREVETAIRLLLELVARALDLPDADIEDAEDEPDRADDDAIAQVRRRLAVLPVGLYGTLDPEDVAGDQHLVGDVLDDLADVWRDVRQGLDAFRAGKRDLACWTWKFSFENHWGEHAVEALRVLVIAHHAR
jgi:hypothetical protein